MTDQSLRAVFWKLDKDGTGYIPVVVVKEVAEGLASQCQVEYNEDLLVDALSQFAHTDGMQGFVSEDQFQTLLLEMFAKVRAQSTAPAHSPSPPRAEAHPPPCRGL